MTFVGAIGVGAVCGWSISVLRRPAESMLERAGVIAATAAVAAEAALIGGRLVGAAALGGAATAACLGRLWLRGLRARRRAS